MKARILARLSLIDIAGMIAGSKLGISKRGDYEMPFSRYRCKVAIVTVAFFAQPMLIGAYTHQNLLDSIFDNRPQTTLEILASVEKGETPRDILTKHAGKWGRTPLHEMAERKWGDYREGKDPQRRQAIDKLVALAPNVVMIRENGAGGTPLPSEGVKEDNWESYMYLRAKESAQDKYAFTYDDLFTAVDKEQPYGVKLVLDSITAGHTPQSRLNEAHGKWGRAILHEMAARDWGNPDKQNGEDKRRALTRAVSLGASLDSKETRSGGGVDIGMLEKGALGQTVRFFEGAGDDFYPTPVEVADTRKLSKTVELLGSLRRLINLIELDQDAKDEAKAQQVIDLLDSGFAPDSASGGVCGYTPLQMALTLGWYEVGGKHRQAVEKMVEKGADIMKEGRCKKTLSDVLKERQDQLPETRAYVAKKLGNLLVKAIFDQDLKRARRLIDDSLIDLNAQVSDDIGNRPLNAMAIFTWPARGAEYRGLVDKAIEKGADPTLKRIYREQTPLMTAEEIGDKETIKYFSKFAVTEDAKEEAPPVEESPAEKTEEAAPDGEAPAETTWWKESSVVVSDV